MNNLYLNRTVKRTWKKNKNIFPEPSVGPSFPRVRPIDPAPYSLRILRATLVCHLGRVGSFIYNPFCHINITRTHYHIIHTSSVCIDTIKLFRMYYYHAQHEPKTLRFCITGLTNTKRCARTPKNVQICFQNKAKIAYACLGQTRFQPSRTQII